MLHCCMRVGMSIEFTIETGRRSLMCMLATRMCSEASSYNIVVLQFIETYRPHNGDNYANFWESMLNLILNSFSA